jgi:hypothetical protein
MNRRQFIFSAVMSAAGSTLSRSETRTVCGKEGNQLPVEQSLVPARGSNVHARVIDGATVLTNCSGESIGLNEMGAAIWNSVDGRMNCYGIAEIHCRRLSLPNESVAADVKEFVDALVQRGYLKIARKTPCYSLSRAARHA